MLVDINKFIKKIIEGSSPKSVVTELLAEEGLTEVGPLAMIAARALPMLAGATGRASVGAGLSATGSAIGQAAGAVSSTVSGMIGNATRATKKPEEPTTTTPPPSAPAPVSDEIDAARALLAELDRRSSRFYEVDRRRVGGPIDTVQGKADRFKKQIRATDSQPKDQNTEPDPQDRATDPKVSTDLHNVRRDREIDVSQGRPTQDTEPTHKHMPGKSPVDPEAQPKIPARHQPLFGGGTTAKKEESIGRVKGLKRDG